MLKGICHYAGRISSCILDNSLIVHCINFFVVKRFPPKKAKELVQVLENIGHNVTNHSSIADVNGLSYFKEEIVAHGDSRRGGAQGSAQY